ncbi:hemagglutinin repeat-containing protein [Paraburkholderia kururiensis]|uniref:hemagglutinin repeat-containing protein n=1 Tax=Paraburkholderia kururiensis TaxID=984307 RepID=UPI0018F6C8CD|nr:hemagglutinin repeat-containing protein [Paraburkholderia kururiensis]
MNTNIYRVIFNAARGLWTVVQETATGFGKGRSAGTTRRATLAAARCDFIDMLSMRHVAFAALCVLGMQPVWVDAQVVAAPGAVGTKTAVGVTANGLPIVQIATPNGAGVSNNTYTQYNVGSSGLILNNSANNVLTQQAGYVAGNPNLASGSARVIVNQVVGGNASQLLGYTEVAGQRAEVVIANPAGIYCNGCGFINTSRGILTTGTPVFGGTGSLDAFHVTGGQIQVGAAGLNGSNVDQVDLIARSVAINGKVWAGQSLNVVAGNNDVRHDDLSAQWLGPDGSSPGVAIDVAQLGGMYAGKIRLVGTEAGVGVNSAGTIASQSGDVQLNSQGKVTLSGTTSASGNVAISAAGDVSNSGSVYATQNTTLNSQGQVTNSGTVAALGNTTVTAAGVNSGGVLGAGVDASGNVTGSGSLTVTGTGVVAATGQQMSGGNLSLSGSSLNMAGAQTLTRGNASLIATGAGGDTGNIVHAGGSLQVGGSLTANAAGTFSNDQGQTGAAQLSVTAGAISNRGGTLSQTGAADTTLVASGALDNTGGTITTNAQNATLRSGSFTNANGQISQAGNGTLNIQTGSLDNSRGSIATNGRATVSAASLGNSAGSITSAQSLNVASNGDIDNTAGRLEASGAVDVSAANVQNAGGRIVSQNGDGLTLTASGQITNASGTTAQGATGGVIGGNGNATIRAGSLANSGTVTAAQTLGVTTSGTLDNSSGTLNGATLSANAASLKNAGGAISGNTVSLSAPQFDNSSGQITANQLNLSATHFANAHGVLTQLGTGAMGFDVSGVLDNSNGGVIQTNSTDLTLAPATLDNDGGTITHAGTGTLTINAASGAGGVTNVGGTVTTNGRAVLAAGNIDNTRGTISAQTGLAATVTGVLNNTHGQIVSNTDMSLVSGGALTNASGTIAATGDGSVQAASVTNSGSITAGGTLSTTATNTLDNSGGTLSAQTVTARAASFRNASGVVSGNTLSFVVPQLDNSGGRITANQLDLAATNLTNAQGSLTQLGSGVMGMSVSGTLDNSNGGVIQTNSTDLTLAPATLDNDGGTITHAGSGTLTIDAANGTGVVTNVGGTIVSNGRTTLSAGSVNNTGGAIGGHSGLAATVAGAVDNTRGQLASNADLDVSSGGALTNTGGTMTATGSNSVQAASLTNGGTITAGQNLDATVAGALDNSNGTMSAQSVTAHAASLRNAGGTVSANTVSLTVPQLDNSSGRIVANQLGITATNLTNGHGSLTQLGASAMGLDVSGTIDNSNGGVIQSNSTDLTLVPAALNNNGGTITHAGTGTLTIAPGSGAGSISNVGGHIATNGQATISVRSLDNTGGTLASQGLMSAVVQTVLNNTGGRLSSGTGLTASSGGALVNAGGVIGAGGAAAGSTLSLTASSINNAGGAITNVGTGATTVNGGSQIANSNAGGAAGMGAISGSGNVTLTASSISNTQGGQLSGANLQINTGSLDNSGGTIGNVANSAGDVGITTGGNLNNASGQIGASRNLSLAVSTLVGGGSYSAVNDLTLNLQGNFTTAPGYGFRAGHNLTFTLPGTFSNGGSLAAVNGLVINAGDIQNTGTMAAGGLLATHSNTLTNTGTIVGGSVSLNATQVLQNLGTSALIGATDSAGVLELLSADIENRDDTTATDAPAMTAIYGLGRVVLAGGKDGNGNYVNAGLVHNQSGLIQSGGDMQIAANQVTNTRRAMSTSGFTSSVDPALLQSLGISLSGCTATDMAACGPGNPQVMGSKGSPTMIGGVPTDPPHGGQWNSTYQYTTYTGVAVANTVTSVSPGSQIIAGGNLNASSVGTFQNYWSQVAAAGNIAMPATLDQNSWQGQTAPQVQVTYSGEYHYDNYDNSEHNWQLPFGDAPFVGSRPGGYTQAAPADIRTYALPAYESSFTAGGTLSGTGVTLNNTAGNASVTPLGLLPGQSISGAGAGAVSGTIATGSTGGRVGAGSVNGTVSTGGGARAVTGAVQGGHIANSGLANFNNPIIAGATAVTVLNNITLPKGGLFSVDAAPNAPYLVETNPAFTSQQQWLSSDYYFQQMGMNSGQIQLRLGDGFYEQKLVQDQIMSMTGKSVLTNYANTQDEFKSLMTSGAELAKSLNLAPGTGLSPDQVSQLTSNVVIMQSQIVDGHEVLVPVVYLAKASQENMGNGPVIAATDIDLQNATTVTNSGTIKATNSFAISAQSIDSSFGTLQSGGNMALVTAGDVNLTSATVNAGNLALQTGGNLVLDTKVKTLDQVSSTGATRVTATLGPLASINVAGNATIITGGNFEQNAGSLNVGGALGMNIGGNWNLGSVQTGEHKVVERANGVSDTDMNQSVGSAVKVGGMSAIAVGGDLTATGANIKLDGGGTIAAAGNVTLQAATATSTVNSNSSGSDHHGSYAETLHTSDDALTATTLQSGGSLSMVAGKDLTLRGSTISLDKGEVTLAAAGNVDIGAAKETHELNSHETHSHSVLVSGTAVASGLDQTATLSQGSTISADGVTIASGKDILVTGSNVVGTNDVTLRAAHDVKITTSQDTQQQDTDYSKREYGFLSGLNPLNQLDGGLQGYTVGVRKTTDAQQMTETTNNGSMIGSLGGNLTIAAGNDVHITGSTIHAGSDLNLAGKSVTIDAAQDTATQNEQQSFSQTAISAGVSSPVLAAVQTGVQMAKDVKHTGGDARLDALAAATTGLAAKNGYDAVMRDPAHAGGIGINVSLGTSHSNSNSTAASSTAVGSTVSAGRDINIAAAGSGAASNIDVIGSSISAGRNATLNAEGNINLQAAQNTTSQHSTNSGSSASIGVTFGIGQQSGISFQLGVSGTKGHADGTETTWTNTHLDAGNVLTLKSSGDTNLTGAVASAQQVIADVGGNLNIQSLQDVTHYDSKQQSGGVSVSICVPPICYGASSVAANFSQNKANSDFASVTEQSGIKAGDRGFQIDVKGNTDLKGAVIASSDNAVQDGLNSLTTATLTHSDVENHAEYSAQQVGIGGGYSFGGSTKPDSGVGKDQKGNATNVNPINGTQQSTYKGFSATPPIALSASGDASSTTKSGISGGALTITDSGKQQQLTGQTAAEAVASINRNTSNTGGSLAPIFDKDKIQAGFDITSQFINQVGTFVDNRLKDVDAAKAAANNSKLTPEQRAQAQQQADQLAAEWGPGGTYRQVLTALTAAAGGNVTGGMGQFAQAGLVNYLQQQGAAYIGKLVADGTITEGSPLHAALHAIVACAGAAASSQSCGAGAMGAATASLLTNLFNSTGANDTEQQKQAKENLIDTLVAGIATATGTNAATATNAAISTTDNNYLTQKQQTARALAKANCASSPDPAACRTKVQQAYAALWDANEAKVKNCSTADACKAALTDLRGQQSEYAARENVLQEKLSSGTITTAELDELTSLKFSDTNLISLRTEALSNLIKYGGQEALASLQGSQLIADIGIGAAPGIGGALAGAITGVGRDGIPLVNGRYPINSKYAGQEYPVENLPPELQEKYPQGVQFNSQGFPDFSPYARAKVSVEGLTGDYSKDAALSNKAAGFSQTPDGYVWHHVEDAETMLLIPQDIHDAVRHTGGAAVLK